MSKSERRNQIIEAVKGSNQPISASLLAAQLDVSRQIIVGDIALLRASGHNISSTPKGYIFENDGNLSSFGYTGIIACRHDEKRLLEELYAIVDLGGTIIDVTIEHSTYGQISGRLDISSRRDADDFINQLKLSQSKPLSDLTDGIHLHKIGCRDEDTFNLIVNDLVAREISLT